MRVVRCALLVLLVAPAVSKKATAAAAGFDPVSGTRTAAAEAKEPAAAKAEEGYEDFQGAKVRTHTETPSRLSFDGQGEGKDAMLGRTKSKFALLKAGDRHTLIIPCPLSDEKWWWK